MHEQVDVAIVGGGFSGAMVAANLLAAARPLRLALIERRMPPGHGVAYGTPDDWHLLNIPAGEMSAWPDAPDHFVAWLRASGLPSGPGVYAPRRVYGDYVQAVLAEAAERAPGRLALYDDEAIALLPEDGLYRLKLASGRLLYARRLVLAIGQFSPAPLRVAAGLSGEGWYAEDPWRPEALAPLSGEALLIGTGLTAVDAALALLRGGAARVHLVSRRAQLPAAQREGAGYRDWLDPSPAPTRVSRLWRLVRRAVIQAQREGVDWRAVIDAMKPHVPALWARLPLVERRRFLRHARSYWEAHRNRLPPPTAERVAAYMAEGRLVVHAARLRELVPSDGGAIARLTLRSGGELSLAVARVVNCTGPDTQYRQINHPLVLDLIGTGMGRPDPLGLGLDVSPDGRLKDEDGYAGRPIYTLGWPRQGQLWDATTVPSLREQAREVAERVGAPG